jgi:hypothetical protein
MSVQTLFASAKVICPFCNKPTKKTLEYVSSTLMYYPLIFDENGNIIPDEHPDGGQYYWKCLECSGTFISDSQGSIISKTSSQPMSIVSISAESLQNNSCIANDDSLVVKL